MRVARNQLVLNVLLGATFVLLSSLRPIKILCSSWDSFVVPRSFMKDEVDLFKCLAAGLERVIST